jgi:hypothetical protein
MRGCTCPPLPQESPDITAPNTRWPMVCSDDNDADDAQVIALCNVVMLVSYFEASLLIRRWRKTVFVTTHPLERVRSSTILINYCARVFLLYWVGYGKRAAAKVH